MNNREVIEWLRKKAETVPMPGARKMYEAAAKAILCTHENDLISRQAAIDTLTRLEPSFRGSVLEQALKNMPPAQPEPSVAYWKKDVFGTVICSKCGGIRMDNRLDYIQWCNRCGCYMRGGTR